MKGIQNEQDFENKLMDALVKSKLVKHVVMKDVLEDVEQKILIDMLEKPSKISFDEFGIYYEGDDGEKIQCPSYGINLQADGMWLSDKILDISFDIEQNGNVRKADEAQAIYCCLVVCSVLNDEDLKEELKQVITNYDYISMTPKGGFSSFRDLLNTWQELQSILINVSVSAANYKIADLKKDSERFLKDSMSEETSLELRNLTDAIKAVNRRYSQGELSPINVQNLKKIEILSLIANRDDEVETLITNSNVELEYRITKLNSQYLSPLVKRKIQNLARKTVSDLYTSQADLSLIVGDIQTIEERWRKRFLRLSSISLRKEQLEKLSTNRESYQLPSKL